MNTTKPQVYREPGVRYIVVEGLDASGKDTAVAYIAGLFTELGKYPIVIAHGYGCDLGRQIIQDVKDSLGTPDDEMQKMFMLWVERLQFVKNETTRLLESGVPAADIVVVFNRFTDSTFLYQCIMKHGSLKLFKILEGIIKEWFTPDFTILLTCSQRVQLNRIQSRVLAGTATDRSEKLCIANYNTMASAYQARYYERNKGAVICTDLSLEATKAKVLKTLQKYFEYM